jgi:hypothetical protein
VSSVKFAQKGEFASKRNLRGKPVRQTTTSMLAFIDKEYQIGRNESEVNWDCSYGSHAVVE